MTGGTAATIPGTYTSGTYPSVLISGTGSTLTVNAPLVIDDTENLSDVLTIENNGRFIANANVTLTNSVFPSNPVDATVSSGGVRELQSGTFAVGGQLRLGRRRVCADRSDPDGPRARRLGRGEPESDRGRRRGCNFGRQLSGRERQ